MARVQSAPAKWKEMLLPRRSCLRRQLEQARGSSPASALSSILLVPKKRAWGVPRAREGAGRSCAGNLRFSSLQLREAHAFQKAF